MYLKPEKGTLLQWEELFCIGHYSTPSLCPGNSTWYSNIVWYELYQMFCAQEEVIWLFYDNFHVSSKGGEGFGISFLGVGDLRICSEWEPCMLFTFHLNCKYHPWELINDMQMSKYNRKHWHALPHSLHFVRHPRSPASKLGSRLPIFNSVCLGLVPGQIDSPYLIIMSWITIPRDEYYTMQSNGFDAGKGHQGILQVAKRPANDFEV